MVFGIRFEPVADESWTDVELYSWTDYVVEEVVEFITYKRIV